MAKPHKAMINILIIITNEFELNECESDDISIDFEPDVLESTFSFWKQSKK